MTSLSIFKRYGALALGYAVGAFALTGALLGGMELLAKGDTGGLGSPTTRAPRLSMFASLCARIMAAEKLSEQTPQRMPGTLLAAIMMP